MKKKDVFKRWKKRSLKFKIIVGIVLVIAILALPYVIMAGLLTLFTKATLYTVWGNGLLYALWGGVELAFLVFALFEYRTLGSRRVKKVNADLEDSHFMSDKEITADNAFTVTEFSELGNVQDGLLIKAERQKNRMEVVLMDPIHAVVIATTGTGKTTTYVEPFIEIMSRTSTKPCMIITDPKGELYGRHATTLKKNGYNVHIVDFTDTYHSSLWNPFNDVWKKTEKISAPITQEKNKYRWDGRLYDTFAMADQAKKEFTVRLNDEIFQDLRDLLYTACPVEAAQDKSWQQGARDLLLGMALRLWEDLRDGYLPKEKFNFYNLWWNLTTYGKPDPETAMCDVLIEYVQYCADDVSKAAGLANTVLVSQDRTLTSYLGSVNQYLHCWADGGIQQLTSGNEIEFSEWDEAPNVLFIKIPDMKEGRHGLVSLMLLQLYKALDEKGEKNRELNETPDKRLKRHCYFLMDEFGSLPPIRGFDNIVKIARSLGVFMVPVLQDYAQLDKVYGEQPARTIKNNCNVKIFLGTNDEKTRNEISEGCGKHKVKSVSYGENKDLSVNTSAQSVPLIYPSELSKLNEPKNGTFGNAVVLVAGTYPILSHTTPCFKATDIYGIESDASLPQKDFMFFDEVTNRYDITRLISLYRVLYDDDDTSEPRAERPIQENTAPRINVKQQLRELILEEIKILIGKIDQSDYEALLCTDLRGKLKILNELAEKATANDNIFLVMQIEAIMLKLKSYANIGAEAE